MGLVAPGSARPSHRHRGSPATGVARNWRSSSNSRFQAAACTLAVSVSTPSVSNTTASRRSRAQARQARSRRDRASPPPIERIPYCSDGDRACACHPGEALAGPPPACPGPGTRRGAAWQACPEHGVNGLLGGAWGCLLPVYLSSLKERGRSTGLGVDAWVWGSSLVVVGGRQPAEGARWSARSAARTNDLWPSGLMQDGSGEGVVSELLGLPSDGGLRGG